ncbi:MAG TPA: OPT/YSL family transporter [Myxococcaceae bacterium]|nr:OPT/YSL family transporter [Myxococcaceae bacterium]
MDAPLTSGDDTQVRFTWLPRPGTLAFHGMLAAVALLILGPLGGVAAAYMSFTLGVFVPGQILAGILGSVVTYPYGAQGRHGANYMQTMAASVASLGAMAVLIQASVWLGMEMPPAWQLVLFITCVGMFGVGVGMLYTPILVDRMRLDYPSGYAVANIIRALTDKTLLQRSVRSLGAGAGVGALGGWLIDRVPWIGASGLSMSNVGAGLIVGSRIAVPASVLGLVGWLLTPWLRANGWLGANEPFRRLGFLVGLASIMGAALVDLTLIARQALVRARASRPASDSPVPERSGFPTRMLIAWVVFWAVATVVVATGPMHQPVGYILFGLGLSLLFVFINGISTGVSDQNPISSSFVVAVLLMSAMGLRNPVVAITAATVLLICTSVGVDMQQDRSTGWRLGTDRRAQFWYQILGIGMGAVLCVVLARVFMSAYPVLAVNSFDHPEAKVGQWQSALTYKLVGSIRGLGELPAHQLVALEVGFGLGLLIEVLRKLLHASPRYRAFVERPGRGPAMGWVADAMLLPSPYAYAFGTFVELPTALWWGAGGILSSVWNTLGRREGPSDRPATDELPADMSTTSLVGGGLIAGESLFYLAVALIGLGALI